MPDSLNPVPVTVIDAGAVKNLEGGVIQTPPGGPNIILNIVSPLVAILVRFAHSYVTMLGGLLAAGMTTDVLPVTEFVDLFWLSAKLSFAGAAVSSIKDIVTILGKLEGKYPLISGGV